VVLAVGPGVEVVISAVVVGDVVAVDVVAMDVVAVDVAAVDVVAVDVVAGTDVVVARPVEAVERAGGAVVPLVVVGPV